ncbi:MAG TPA: hypothetical protein VF345_12825 [Chthoniobacterales bacterium]
MNSATISIPRRWEAAAFRIKKFVEEYAASYGFQIEAVLASQFDAGQIYLIDDSLTEPERLACENAISALSTRLNSNLSKDVWQATKDVTSEQQQELQEITDLLNASWREAFNQDDAAS